MNLIIIIFN